MRQSKKMLSVYRAKANEQESSHDCSSILEDELLLMLIASKASIKTLLKLRDAGLWPIIRQFAYKEHFWYLLVQSQVDVVLDWQPREWKEVYWNIELRADGQKYLSHYDSMQVFLETGYDPYRISSDDLVTAVGYGNLRVVHLLVERGWCKLSSKTIASALTLSCRLPNYEVTRLLLTKYRSKIVSSLNQFACVSARAGREETLKLFLADEAVDPSTWNPTEFMNTCRGEAPRVVSLLIDDGRLSTDTLNRALVSACSSGRAENVKLLLACKNVDSLTENHEPIIQASIAGSAETIQALLDDRRVNPGARGNVAILHAVESGNEEAVRVLLTDKRVNPTVKKCATFTRACACGHLRIAQLLLEPRPSSSKVIDPAVGENCPLRSAAAANQLDVVRWLLTLHRVDPTSGSTDALGEAACRGHAQMLDMLIRDWRVNLDTIAPRLYGWMGLLRSCMEDRLIGCIVANIIYDGPSLLIDDLLRLIASPSSTIFLLLQFIIVKRPTEYEIMDWLIDRSSIEAALAARSVLDGSLEHKNNEFTAYRALLLVLIGEKGNVVLDRLKIEDGATKEGVLLSATILGAHLGSRSVVEWR